MTGASVLTLLNWDLVDFKLGLRKAKVRVNQTQKLTSLFRRILNRLSLDFGPYEFELEDAEIERDLQYGRGEMQDEIPVSPEHLSAAGGHEGRL